MRQVALGTRLGARCDGLAERRLDQADRALELFKTDVAPEEVPIAEGKADMEAVEAEEIEEVQGLQSGDTAELETDLEAGTYLIICNLPAHFEQGMHTGFTVE